jgi:transposase
MDSFLKEIKINMPRYLTPIQAARATAKLEENWSLAAVAAELHVSKSCIFKLKRRWQQNTVQKPVRAGVGRVSNVQQDNNLVHFVIKDINNIT